MDFSQPWDLGDVTFIVEGRKIYANKGVLTMFSEVFRAMFTSDFKEKQMTEIPLPGKKFADFLALIQLIHPLPNICVDETNVESLLHLAHEYQIHPVVKCCEKVLMKQPSSIHNLILADKFSLSELRKLFFNNLKHFQYGTVQWDLEFVMLDKDTCSEVMERHSMLQRPSIENLLLAEKYEETEVYHRCLKYLKDTELTKLNGEHGFEKLKPATLIDVLTYKVERLEPMVKLLQPQVRDARHQLETLKAEVYDLTCYFTNGPKCANWTRKLSYTKSGSKCSSRDCSSCLHERIARICTIVNRY